ncbi:MAG TPA: EGF domain-containing protein [Polyangiaceae bacterium]|nr:EGF domain-containing protein [Polyangiaceae bacterium]
MKRWVSTGLMGFALSTMALALPGCSVDGKRKYGGPAEADAGETSASGGLTGASAGGRGGSAGTSPSSGRGGGGGHTEPATRGDAPEETGEGGNAEAVFGCGGIVCAPAATCLRAGDEARCECPQGYTDPRADGTLCQDIDECANLNGGCNALVTCTNSPGSFACGACPSGYTGTPETGCVDIDECATDNGGCDALATCTNTPGARVCGNCPFGYSGSGESTCTDIDECATNNGGCDKAVTCVNKPGGFTCGDCPPGHSGGGASGCVDIDECATNNGGCDSHVTCSNSVGSFSCGACPSGYTGTGSSGCVDVNECATNNGGCDGNATCTNTSGSRTCACRTGYTGDGTVCKDVNECATNNGGCDKNAECANTTGSRTCACKTGYSGDGTTCNDVNECATNNGGCSTNAVCTNTTGGRSCACKSGFAGDGLTCTAAGAGCRWNCSGSNCVQVALDQDNDGHGTTACAAAPGDDCNDSDEAVYPGATELCDGIDNDCDRKVDLSDGLPLVGAIKSAPGRNHTAVASAGDGSFGVVSTSSDMAGLLYGTISASGVGSFTTSPMFPPSTDNVYLDPHLAWGSAPGQWGVAYGRNGRGGLAGYAGVMAFTSCCWQDINPPGAGQNYPGRVDVTARGQGDLLFAGAGFGNLYLATQSSSGTTPLTSSLAVSSWDTYTPRVASSGTGSGVIWQTQSPRALNWSAISASLQFGATEQLSTGAFSTDIAAITAGYGIAWIEGTGFRFMIKKPNGATQCTSSVIPFGAVAASQGIALGDSGKGTVVVATSPDTNAIHLYRFDNACKVIDDTDVSTGASAPTEPRVVHGGTNVVVYWNEGTTGRYRFLSDSLCH